MRGDGGSCSRSYAISCRTLPSPGPALHTLRSSRVHLQYIEADCEEAHEVVDDKVVERGHL